MEDENEYKKLPTEEKCVHKLWKARIAGYEEAIKLFNQIDDEKSPEWNKYLGLIKKFVTDSNAVAQEKGLEAALVFVENCGHAGKTTGEVMSGIVAKCIAAPKTKTKDLALQLTLMYIEIEKHEVVEEELLKGMEQKNPKVVAACIATLNHSLKQFGNKVIAIKPMVKKIPILLADRDKSVRDEMKALIVEMHRWIGAAIESHIATLQPVVQQELRESFSSSGRAQPVRYLRSQQHRVRDAPADSVVDGAEKDEDDDAGGGDSAELDPYELLDPVDILSKLPKDFYDKLEAKKWQDRKEALDVLENLLKTAPKLEPGDYADLVRALKKIISKDANVLLVALSGRLLAQVANGIRNKFQPYATACVQAILEKFKEKKAVVVTSLREAIDAIYPTTNLEAIMEDMLAAFDNKNPSIKAESSLFLARALCVTQPAAFNKKLIKAYVGGLLKLIESADLSVRDAAAEALGTATKLVGEKNIAPHIGKLDNLKEQKIKEFADKAEIKVKISAPKKEKPKGAALSGKGDSKPSGSAQPKPVKRPPTGKKLAPSKKATASRAPTTASRERELSQEEVDAAAETLFPADVINGLSDGNWKNRLSAVQSVHSTIQRLSSNDVSAQVLYRMLNKKPGLKDTNVQVMKARLEACKYITENFPISETAADVIIQDVVTKLAESSCGAISAYCLTYLAEGCGLEHVLMQGLTFAMDLQKNPKVQSEMFNWMANAIKEFGFTVNIKSIIAHSKKALSATNPNVRTSAVNFLGVVSLYVGPSLINQFDSEKPATKQLIGAEIDKYANSSPPSPTRKVGTVSKSSSKASVAEEIEEASEGALDEEVIIVDDNRPLTDIAPLMTDSLLEEITDKNWKVRDKGLEKLKAIISSSSPIKTSLGELPKSLLSRLVDSNSKLVQTALQICEQLAVAMGNKCKHHVRTFFPVFFQAFGDNKQWIRTAAVSCVETWCKEAGPHAPFEGEMVLDALKAGSPVLRATLLQWLADKLPDVPPKSFPREELAICVPVIYIFIEDRSAEVRRAAGECVLPFMLHLGYEAMHKQLDKVKPSSKSVIEAVLDNARPNLPVQPLPAAKGKKEEPRTVKSAGALKKESEKKVSAPSKGKVKPIPGNQRGRNDEDSTPLLPINNGKNQRIIDDQKLRALKWNFTTPREEFILLLKDQMATAGLNKQLLINMFHTDFRHHIKAIEALSLDLQDNGKSLVANLDLVLKWLTLRFFDTNPAVILKGLEYLSLVFQYLIEADYTMPEYEANCFIPYLVLKVGDPKDTVRSGVKALFKQICIVYSVTKLFGYLMEGLKSKNARQRAECLECIGHLVETYGSVVLSSGAGGGAALRELSRHIGDRDNSVRSAALNCVANVYFLEGEKVYKMIGQISDKDLSLLEERIKRAAKSRTSEERQGMIVPLSASGKPMQRSTACQPKEMESQRHRILVEDTEVTSGDEEEEEKPPEPVIQPSTPEPKVIPGPFGLDPDLVAKLDAATPTLKRTNVTEHDLAFLNEPIPLDAGRPRTAVGSQNIRPSMVTMRSPRSVPVPVPRSLIVSDSFAGIDDLQLADTIHSISSPDLTAAIRALSLISGALASGRGAALVSHEDRLMRAIAELMQHLRTAPPSASDNIFIGYKYLAQTLISFYETPECGSHVGEFTLSLVISEILKVLGANGKGAGEAEESEKLVRMLNNVCVRLLERSHKTSLLCALVSLLHESVGASDAAYPRYQELLLKCLWKCLKLITTWEVNWLDYDAVLYKIHLFYKAYPNSFWKRSPDINDTPYRTIKTLVHTIVKKKGASITCHLTQIPDANESELYPYLLKIIKLLNLDDKRDPMDVGTVLTTVTGNNSALNAGRLPRAVHEELALILNQISMKEHNKEAMEKLFDLREQHPEVNIWTFMQGTTFFFRSYVENGLREVAEKRKLASMPVFTNNDYNTGIIDLTNENDEQLHLLHLEKLRALQAKAGLKTEPSTSQARTPMRDNRLFTESFNENTLPRPHSIDPQLELRTPQSVYPRDEAAVESLRRKLQQIKSSSKR